MNLKRVYEETKKILENFDPNELKKIFIDEEKVKARKNQVSKSLTENLEKTQDNLIKELEK